MKLKKIYLHVWLYIGILDYVYKRVYIPELFTLLL